MSLRKKGFLPLSTESGQIGWTIGPWFLLFMGILLCACLQLEVFKSSFQYMEDALAASNLAAAVIDVEEYGRTHGIRIADPEEACRLHREALKGNLNLNEEWECDNRELISGPVQIDNFTVYNVSGNDVEIYCFEGDGEPVRRQGTLGSVMAPNGITVEATGIYSEISYRIKGLLGVEITAHKGKLVDVVKTEEP